MEISIYAPDDSEKIYLSFIDRVNLYFTTKVLDGLFNDMKNIYEDNININNMSVIIKIPTKYKWDLLNSNYYKTNTEGIIEVYSLIYINYLLGEENDQIRIIPSEHINKYNNFEVVRCIFNAYSKMFFTGNNQVIGFSSNVKCELFSTQHYENKLGEQKHKNIDKMIFNFTGNYYNCSSEEIKNLSHKDKFYYDTNLHNFHLNYREIPQ